MKVLQYSKVIILTIFASYSLLMASAAVPQTTPKTEYQQYNYLDSLINIKKDSAFVKKLATGLGTALSTIIALEVIVRSEGESLYTIFSKKPKTETCVKTLLKAPFGAAAACLASSLTGALLCTILNLSTPCDVMLVGGITGTCVYHPAMLARSLYQKLFLGEKQCLNRTLKAFKVMPADFPKSAHPILQNAEQNFAIMNSEQIIHACKELRALRGIWEMEIRQKEIAQKNAAQEAAKCKMPINKENQPGFLQPFARKWIYGNKGRLF